MALLQRLGLGGGHRAQQALLEQRVNALQSALTRCKGVATRWRRTQWGLMTGVGVAMLALGFLAGLYSQSIKQTVTGVAAHPAASARPNDSDPGYAAYQKADYETALRILRPRAEQGDPRAETTIGVMYAKGEAANGHRDNVNAHMWFNLAASRFSASEPTARSAAIKSRDAVASKMTSEEIAHAQQLARDWRPKQRQESEAE